jgi:hypothetical protein
MLVWNSVPGLIHITPMVNKDVTGAGRSALLHWTVNGVLPGRQDILHLPTRRAASSMARRSRSGRMWP